MNVLLFDIPIWFPISNSNNLLASFTFTHIGLLRIRCDIFLVVHPFDVVFLYIRQSRCSVTEQRCWKALIHLFKRLSIWSTSIRYDPDVESAAQTCTLRVSLTITEITLSNNTLPGFFGEQSCILFPSTKPKCYPHLYCPPNNYWETKAPSKPLPTLKIWVTKDFKKVISLTQWYWAMKIYDIYGLYGWGEHEALAQTSWKLLI